METNHGYKILSTMDFEETKGLKEKLSALIGKEFWYVTGDEIRNWSRHDHLSIVRAIPTRYQISFNSENTGVKGEIHGQILGTKGYGYEGKGKYFFETFPDLYLFETLEEAAECYQKRIKSKITKENRNGN